MEHDSFYDQKTIKDFMLETLCVKDSKMTTYYNEGDVKKFRKRLSKKNTNKNVETVVYVCVTDAIRDIIYREIDLIREHMKHLGKIVITGGDAFNFYFKKENRMISSDIDTKFAPFMNDSERFFGHLQITKLVLWDYLGKICKKISREIKGRLTTLLKNTNIGKLLGIRFQTTKPDVTRRYTLLKKKRQDKDTDKITQADVLSDIELFALDLKISYYHPELKRIKLVNLGGILDIAFMRPNEIGYEIIDMNRKVVSCVSPLTGITMTFPNLRIASKRFLIQDIYTMSSLNLRPDKKSKDRNRIRMFTNNILKMRKNKNISLATIMKKLSYNRVTKTKTKTKTVKEYITMTTNIRPQNYTEFTTPPNKSKLERTLLYGKKYCVPAEGLHGESDGIYRFNLKTQKWNINNSNTYVKNEISLRPLQKSKLQAKDKLNGLDLLYGYNQQRDDWLPLQIYKKSMMIPFIGLQSKLF